MKPYSSVVTPDGRINPVYVQSRRGDGDKVYLQSFFPPLSVTNTPSLMRWTPNGRTMFSSGVLTRFSRLVVENIFNIFLTKSMVAK